MGAGGDKTGSVRDQSDHSGKRPHFINLDECLSLLAKVVQRQSQEGGDPFKNAGAGVINSAVIGDN